MVGVFKVKTKLEIFYRTENYYNNLPNIFTY